MFELAISKSEKQDGVRKAQSLRSCKVHQLEKLLGEAEREINRLTYGFGQGDVIVMKGKKRVVMQMITTASGKTVLTLGDKFNNNYRTLRASWSDGSLLEPKLEVIKRLAKSESELIALVEYAEKNIGKAWNPKYSF